MSLWRTFRHGFALGLGGSLGAALGLAIARITGRLVCWLLTVVGLGALLNWLV